MMTLIFDARRPFCALYSAFCISSEAPTNANKGWICFHKGLDMRLLQLGDNDKAASAPAKIALY